MNVFHVTLDGRRTTVTLPPFLTALLWGEGIDDLPGWLQAQVDEEPERWTWSAEWSDTVSGRLQAICLRYVADDLVVARALKVAHAVGGVGA